MHVLFILNRISPLQTLGTALFVFKLVIPLPNYVAAAKRGPTAPESAKLPTGKSLDLDNVIRTGAVIKSTEKGMLTGKLFQFQTKDWA